MARCHNLLPFQTSQDRLSLPPDLVIDTLRAKTVQEPTGQPKQINSWDINSRTQLFQESGHGTEEALKK